MKKSTQIEAKIQKFTAELEVARARLSSLDKKMGNLNPKQGNFLEMFLKISEDREKAKTEIAGLEAVKELAERSLREQEAGVMEAEVASEGRAAAKKPLKKTDKRKSPAFIAHLRALAESRRKKTTDKKAAPAPKKAAPAKPERKTPVKGKIVSKKSA